MFAAQKMRHSLMGNTIYLVSGVNPLKILVTKAGSLNARLAKWSILLSQYDIIFVPQKAVKGQSLADFLEAHPLRENSKLQEELPDEAVYCTEVASRPTSKAWEMYFDGASRTDEKGRPTSGVGIVFIIYYSRRQHDQAFRHFVGVMFQQRVRIHGADYGNGTSS